MKYKRPVLLRTAGAVVGGVALASALGIAAVPAHAAATDSVDVCDFLDSPIAIDAWHGATWLEKAAPGSCQTVSFSATKTLTIGFFLNNQPTAHEIGSVNLPAGDALAIFFQGPASNPTAQAFIQVPS